MNKKIAELVNAVLALLVGGVLTKRRAAILVRQIFETDKDASLGASPDNSKSEGTGCTRVGANIKCTLVFA